jgi:hypothetical protein
MEDSTRFAKSAAQKMATGSLMTIDEVAAKLDVAPMTVHRLPIESIRLGRLLRFDPKDVDRLIQSSKEATIAPGFSIAPAPITA